MDLLAWISWDVVASDSGTAGAAKTRLGSYSTSNVERAILSAGNHPKICRRAGRSVRGAGSGEGMRIRVRRVAGFRRAVKVIFPRRNPGLLRVYVHLRSSAIQIIPRITWLHRE